MNSQVVLAGIGLFLTAIIIAVMLFFGIRDDINYGDDRVRQELEEDIERLNNDFKFHEHDKEGRPIFRKMD